MTASFIYKRNNVKIKNLNVEGFNYGKNSWNATYPIGGNYWSDYKGVDNFRGANQNLHGSSGIDDMPYNISYAQTHIIWVWTDPSDTDFSKVMIYLNGSFQTSVAKGIQFYKVRRRHISEC